MFMSHALYPGVWMLHPLQLLQTQIARSGLTRPIRRTQSFSTGGATNGGFTVTPAATPTPTPTPAPAPASVAAEESSKTAKK